MATKINPEDFRTAFDAQHTTYKTEQAAKGRELAKQGFTMYVAESGVWSGSKEGTSLQAYEKLGFHACVIDLIQGFLEAGGKCKFHGFRGINDEVTL